MVTRESIQTSVAQRKEDSTEVPPLLPTGVVTVAISTGEAHKGRAVRSICLPWGVPLQSRKGATMVTTKGLVPKGSVSSTQRTAFFE